MKITHTFIENFAHPTGVLGRVLAWKMDISNRQANLWTLSLLALQPTDHVLEAGFGSGNTLRIAAELLPAGFICGLDSSPTMLKIAQKNNIRLINQGRMELRLGDVERIPYEDNRFDKAYAVEVINYLPDPVTGLKELLRVTKPGGRVALFFEAKEKFDQIRPLIAGIYHPYAGDDVLAMMKAAGFSAARVETRDFVSGRIHYRGHVALGEKETT